MEVEILILAFGIGLLANIDPCCGGATVLWSSVLGGAPDGRSRLTAIGFGLGRAGVLASVGVAIGLAGFFVTLPLAVGFLILAAIFAVVGVYELKKGLRAGTTACPAAFDRHGRSPLFNAAFLFLPPPLVFILFSFFDDISAVPPVDAAIILGFSGLGLSLPLFTFAASPGIHRFLANRLGGGRVWPVRIAGVFLLLGAVLYIIFAALTVTGSLNPPG